MVRLADANAKTAGEKATFPTAGTGSIKETFKQPGGRCSFVPEKFPPPRFVRAGPQKNLQNFKELLQPDGMLLLQMRHLTWCWERKNAGWNHKPGRKVQKNGFSSFFTTSKPTARSSSTSCLFIENQTPPRIPSSLRPYSCRFIQRN